MKINNFKIFNIQKQQKNEKCDNISSSNFLYSNNISNPIYKDTFQRTTQKTQEISFKGENNDEAFIETEKDTVDFVLSCMIFETGSEEVIDELMITPDEYIRGIMETYIDALKTDGFLSKKQDHSKAVVDFLNQHGILYCSDMAKFARTRLSVDNFDEIFGKHPTLFLRLYHEVKDRNDLINFPALASDFYAMKMFKPDMYSLDELFSFLKENNIKNEKSSLDKRINDLAPHFNNFKSYHDKSSAVWFLMKNRDDELEKLQNLLDKKEIKLSAKQVYNCFPTIFDVRYLASDGQGFEELEPYIQDLIDVKNLKGYPKVCADSDYGISSSPENYFKFLDSLEKLNISVKQYAELLNKPFITDIDPKIAMMMFTSTTKALTETRRLDSKEEAQQAYTNFGDCISAILCNKEAAMEDVDSFFDIIEKYKIKDSKAFLDFYKKCNTYPENKKSANKKKPNNNKTRQNTLISPEKMLEFVRLFKFDTSDDLFNEAKKQNIPPIHLLQQEEERFEAVKKGLDEHILKDEDCIFAGRPALDIYFKYRKEFIKNPNNIARTISEIAKKEISETFEYELRKREFEGFDEYFDSDEDKIKFIENSQIDLTSKKAASYKDACKDLLKSAKEQLPEQEYKKFSRYLSNNDFLAKTKYAPKNIQQLLSVSTKDTLKRISEGKISSIEQFLSLLDEYKDEDSNTQNIVTHLNNALKSMSFEEYKDFLSDAQDKLKSYGTNIKINNKNISYLPLNLLEEGNSKETQTLGLLKRLYKSSNNDSELNFISSLSSAFVKKHKPVAELQIIQEIISRSDSVDSQYVNLNRVFGLQDDIDYYRGDKNAKVYFKTSQIVQGKIPQEFFDFVNSNDWTKITNDGKCVNLTPHARLRLIERFVLNNYDSIEDINYKEMAQKLNAVLKAVYSSKETKIKLNPITSKLEVSFKFDKDNSDAVAIFDKSGVMVTIYPKGKKH